MLNILVSMRADIEALKTSSGNATKVGPISHVDAKKGYRMSYGEGTDGNPVYSPWYPHPESGGSTSTWQPMKVGQIVGVVHPTGDHRQGVLFHAGFSDNEAPPSQDLEANVVKAFGVTMTMKGGKLVIDGDVEINGSTEFKGGTVKHDGHSIDNTHKHKGVMAGLATTDVPG